MRCLQRTLSLRVPMPERMFQVDQHIKTIFATHRCNRSILGYIHLHSIHRHMLSIQHLTNTFDLEILTNVICIRLINQY